MATYQVSFFKTLLNCDGHQFRCLQECIEVDNVHTPAQAAARAAKQFEIAHHTPLWSQCADSIDIVEIRKPADRSVQKSSRIRAGIRHRGHPHPKAHGRARSA